MASSESVQQFIAIVEELKENPCLGQRVLLQELLDAVIDLWNEDISGSVEFPDGDIVDIQPILG